MKLTVMDEQQLRSYVQRWSVKIKRYTYLSKNYMKCYRRIRKAEKLLKAL